MNVRTVLPYLATAVVSVGLTVVIVFVVLAPNESVPRTSFADLERDVQAGRVDDITIDGHTYRYRVRGGGLREAEGPEPTLASVDALHPTNPDAIATKIRLER